ncbi:hypothetical protein [Pseudoalteromonas sp. S1688]|uniref:hypothetical protein n=1 Tax=Pseudoalteromonas sp. S1688 TaxID=579511 RepID=UPI00110A19C2|nr:hypothetical protein [Pseudoalteromonas sp. S1688]TMP48704.1 hypothetical protein CWB81_15925 [Pseudoalteromonas sp. S1688]
MTDKTKQHIEATEAKVMAMLELGELDSAVVDYIELLQETITTYQGELYAKNSQISSLEYKLANIDKVES